MTKNFSILFIIITTALVSVFFFGYQKKISVTTENKETEIKEQNFGMTFAVFGEMGKVVGWNTAPDLADSVMIVNYSSAGKIINVVSLPRDLYVNLGGQRFKLNEVVQRGKIEEFLAKLPDIAGLETDKFAVVNIDMVKNVVDNLNGIDINLKSDAIDRVSGYVMKAGLRHLSGDDAVWLVRNRFNSEGDFFREKNQYEIIRAIAGKYKNLSPIEKSKFMLSMFPDIGKIKTNMDFQKIFAALEKAGDIAFNDVVLDFSTGLLVATSTPVAGSSTPQYILVPKAGRENYSEIKNYIQGKLEK